jgi:hypothetical protein
VTVEADGKGNVKKVRLDPASVNPADVEMLEDLITVAAQDAQTMARAAYHTAVAVAFPYCSAVETAHAAYSAAHAAYKAANAAYKAACKAASVPNL